MNLRLDLEADERRRGEILFSSDRPLSVYERLVKLRLSTVRNFSRSDKETFRQLWGGEARFGQEVNFGGKMRKKNVE